MIGWWLCLLLVVGCLGQEEEDPFDGKYILARAAFTSGDLSTAQDLLEEVSLCFPYFFSLFQLLLTPFPSSQLLPEHGEQYGSLYADLAVAYMYNNRVNDAHKTYVFVFEKGREGREGRGFFLTVINSDGLDIHSGDGMLHRGFCQFC